MHFLFIDCLLNKKIKDQHIIMNDVSCVYKIQIKTSNKKTNLKLFPHNINNPQLDMSQPSNGIQQSPSRQLQRSKPVYDAVLPNNRASNSANYIPTKIYESYREQNTSQMSKVSNRSNLNNEQITAYQKLSQLTQRLKNIHHFYKLRIDQEKSKNAQRNEVFMSIVEELQKSHNQRISSLKREIQTADQQKKQVSYVDDKVSQIKGSIDEILKQSASYKMSNQKLEKEIMQKEDTIREKQRTLEKLNKEEIQFRNQLEQFMKLNLKENRRQREMLQMIDNVVGTRGF